MVVINMLIHGVKDATSGVMVDVPGGMTGYDASITADPSGVVELVDVRGVVPFSLPTRVGLTVNCHDLSPSIQPADTVTAR